MALTDQGEDGEISTPDISARISQIHHAYLDCLYQIEYYVEARNRTSSYARHFDFLIGLGAATGGGSGLGILAEPYFAIPCAIATSASVILSIAKSTYDWQGRITKATEIIDYFRRLASRYYHLIDDLNYYKDLDTDREALHLKLRADFENAPSDPYPPLKQSRREAIKQRVEENTDRTFWWKGSE